MTEVFLRVFPQVVAQHCVCVCEFCSLHMGLMRPVALYSNNIWYHNKIWALVLQVYKSWA